MRIGARKAKSTRPRTEGCKSNSDRCLRGERYDRGGSEACKRRAEGRMGGKLLFSHSQERSAL